MLKVTNATILSVLLCGAATAAFAQTAPPEPADQAQTSLDDIIVTAQRRAESLQRVAVAVSAVGGEELVQAGISDIQNLSRVVPSVIIQPGGGGANIYLRGVGNQQTNSFGENAVAFNFAGVYFARPTAPFGVLYDLERVEVVKGPQGTLYGRNATGGAINVLPRRPVLGSFGGEANLEYGNYDTVRASGGINLPLGENVAVRIAGQIVDRDGYLSDGYNDEVGQAARISLLAQPDPSLSIQVIADWFHQGGKGQGGVLAPGAYVPQAPALSERIGGSDPRSIAALLAFGDSRPPFGTLLRNGSVITPAGDGFYDSTFYGLTGIVEKDLGFATLTVQGGYRQSEPDYVFYFTGFRGQIDETDEQKSLEIRLASNSDGPFRYIAGAYYFDETQKAENFFNQGRLSTTRFDPRLTTESKALFGQATWAITDTVRLVGGLRYTDEVRTLRTRVAAGNPATPNPAFVGPFLGEQDVSRVTGKGGIEIDLAPRSLLYANVATGFKSGGFFVGASPDNVFNPETLTAYTIGSKNQFFDNRLRLNAEAFFWDYEDQQVSFVGGVNTGTGRIVIGGKTVNAGQAKIYGAEIDLEWLPFDNGSLTASLQYLDTEYDSFSYTAFSASGAPVRSGCVTTGNRLANPGTTDTARLYDINCAGKPVLNSPKWSMRIAYEHAFPLGAWVLTPGISTRIESARETTIEYLPESQQGSYTSSDAQLTLTAPADAWRLTGYVNNIEDETILAGGFTKGIIQTFYATLRPPRTYGLRLSVPF